MRRMVVSVLGSDEDQCTPEAYEMAEEVGKELANHGIITLTGGGKGIMEAAAKGAQEAGGTTIGILWEEEFSAGNDYLDIVIPAGIGFARDMINSYASDAVILVEGGVGTLSESTYAYFQEKPIIALENSGGTAEKYAGKYLDNRELVKIHSAETPNEAVDIVTHMVEFKEKDGLLYKEY